MTTCPGGCGTDHPEWVTFCHACGEYIEDLREAGGFGSADKRSGDSPEGGTAPREPSVVSLTLPWSVLASSNLRHAARGGKAHDPEYTAARDNATALAGFAYTGPPIERPVRVSMAFYPPNRRRRDSTNLTKCLLDALKRGGVLADDSDKIVRAWEGSVSPPDSDPRCEVAVTVLDLEAAA